MLGQDQPSMSVLMELLPTKEQQIELMPCNDGTAVWESFRELDEAIVKSLREAAGGCPACMMAALRQRGLPVHTAQGFDFSTMCKSIWADINAAEYEKEMERERYALYY